MDPTHNQTAYITIASCYNSLNNQVIFSWEQNQDPYAPYYAIYSAKTGQFTQPPFLMNEGYTQGVLINIFNCYNSLNNEIIFSWAGNTNKAPYYSVYNATSQTFTTPAKINESYNLKVVNDVFCCYNSLNNEIIFSWADNTAAHNPYYSIYNATLQTFTTLPAKINNSYTQGVYFDVFCCYNSLNNEVIFSWANKTGTKTPYYSVYNATSKTFTTPAKINDNYTQGVSGNVFCCYNSQNNEIIFSWADNTAAHNPYYSVYNATLKTFTTLPAVIDESYTQGVYYNVFCCYNSLNNEIIFSWANNTTAQNPYYSIYNATSKTFTTIPTLIDESYTQGVYCNVFCCYNSQNNQTIFSWTDNTSHHNPYYAIYTEPLPQRVAANRLLQAQTLSSMKWQKGVITKSSSSDN